MQNKISRLFSSEQGKKIYNLAIKTIDDYSMNALLDKGVLIGLSGGADSVMLLCFLYEYRRNHKNIPMIAVHINHCIRADEADRDEEFSKHLCEELGVEFLSIKIDVPRQAEIDKIGLEECARKMRYQQFENIISSRSDIDCIAVAHNSDDNVETVLLNMLRGCGSRGAAGIPPVRNNVIRPLIKVSKSEIVEVLEFCGIQYVTDSTNFNNDYKRNFVRNEISPKLLEIAENPALMIGRMSDNLRSDDEFINCCANDFIAVRNKILNSDLLKLHRSLRARVIAKMSGSAAISLSSVNFDDLEFLLSKDNFSYSLPGEYVFRCERGVCTIISSEHNDLIEYNIVIPNEKNIISDFDSVFYLTDGRLDESSLNVYKLSIQADISSAIIEGGLYLRPKKDGDTVFYGGITHKMKKLYNDRKIPVSLRPFIPLLCDDRGVVWAPGFGVRDDKHEKKADEKTFATLCIGTSDSFAEKRFYSGSEFVK